ncbi:hypothetical protein FQN54_007822 [Arachnomyces sp. PD_36]|nr:hypothetical protein FQN54_007822 [Arachnomyces sp. PD_36]
MKLSVSSSAVTAVATVLFSSSLVAGQTFTDCNPLKKTCPPNPGLGTSKSFDFTQGESGDFVVTGGTASYDGNGASLAVAKSGDAPTLTSNFYIFFGHVEFVIKAAPGTGIVSSAVMQSDDLDEIDWEWLGVDSAQVQTNYFGKGLTTSYDRGAFHPNPDNSATFHTYAVDWTADKITWSLDGAEVRTLLPADAGNEYPQTPMQIKVGNWAGGDPRNAQGTIDWAGGETDFNAGPYVMQVKSIDVTDYSSGSQYIYTDNSGSWQSIKAVDGATNGNGNDSGDDGEDSGDDGENGPDGDSPSVTEGPSVITDPIRTTGMTTTTVDRTGYPWVPKPTDTQDTGSPVTSYAGLPSDWIVTDTGAVSEPNTATDTSLATSPSSPSPSGSSSVNGPEDPAPTGGSESPSAPVQTGAASSSFGAPSSLFIHAVNAFCAGFGALALF